MTKIGFQLSPNSIEKAISELKEYAKKVDNVSENLPNRLAIKGQDFLINETSIIKDPDGNDLGTTRIELGKGKSKVFQEGKQIYYLEFGTGFVGASNSHPKYKLVSWDYASGDKINDLGSWGYFNKQKQKFRTTYGIPAQMQVYNTGQYLRKIYVEEAREMLNQ